MASRNEETTQPESQAVRAEKLLERQLKVLEARIIELKVEALANNCETNNIETSMLHTTLNVLGDALDSLSRSLGAELQLPQPPCKPVILRGLKTASKILMHLKNHIRYEFYNEHVLRKIQKLINDMQFPNHQ